MAQLNGSNNTKILIVDDEPAGAQLLKMLLSTHGYYAQVAATGQKAMGHVPADVDLILLDILLPDFEGFKICQQFKSNPQTHDIPILIISGKGDNTEEVQGFYLGADDYLTKPFEAEKLFSHIEAILHRRHVMVDGGYSQGQYETIGELRRIIDQELIVPYFQPIYFLKPMRLFGFEMLSRPQTIGAMVDPEVLFQSALQHGVYYEIEMIAWRKAIKKVVDIFDGRQSLFLNCNPYLVEREEFKNIEDMFCQYGLPCDRVFLEITERSAIIEHDVFFKRLLEYRRHGFKIAVDDLGGGYSSLESIMETRPEVVKLDRRIVFGIGNEDPFQNSIVKLVVAFCRENSIICVAEGIETKRDLDALIALGVDAGQGYYLCRPTDKIDIKAMQSLRF